MISENPILLFVSENYLRNSLLALLSSQPLTIASSQEEALSELGRIPGMLVVIDYSMFDMNIDPFLAEIHKCSSDALILVLTETVQQGQNALRAGADQVLQKDVSLMRLSYTIAQMQIQMAAYHKLDS